MPISEIKKKLGLIDTVFNIETLLSIRPDNAYIQKYYKANQLAYSLFHTKSGLIHMGISRDGIYKADDLLEAARLIAKYIEKLKATTVLELATGRGGTSLWLAANYSVIEFNGIDLSPGQLVYARRAAQKQVNYHPVLGDFHDLSQYKDDSMDVVFVIEALCYSRERPQVFSEVKRVLKEGGVFIVFDAYSKKKRQDMLKQELLACRLAELGMAVEEFSDYPSLLRDGEAIELSVEVSEDVSAYILPTLHRFETLAQRFLKRPRIARLLTNLFARELTYNVISGLLMPDLISSGLACYNITIFKKQPAKHLRRHTRHPPIPLATRGSEAV